MFQVRTWQSQLPSLPIPGSLVYSLAQILATPLANSQPCTHQQGDVPLKDEPKEGAGVDAESELRPFGQGILESWLPRM